MTRQRKAPLNGAEQDNTEGQVHDGSRNIEMASDSGITELTAEEREAAALLRIAGWNVDDNDEVTEDEADLIVRAAESEPVPAEELAHVREGVLRRRFGTPTTPGFDADASMPDDVQPIGSGYQIGTGRARRTPADMSASSEERSAEDRQADAHQADAKARGVSSSRREASVPRPSLIQQWKAPGRRLADLAQSLRLDGETLLTLDRGGARAVPARLVQAAAETLNLSRDEAARCLAPATGDVPPMAAHGRRNAPRPTAAAPREFLEIIEASRLPEPEKRYWRDVVASEIGHDSSREAEGTNT